MATSSGPGAAAALAVDPASPPSVPPSRPEAGQGQGGGQGAREQTRATVEGLQRQLAQVLRLKKLAEGSCNALGAMVDGLAKGGPQAGDLATCDDRAERLIERAAEATKQLEEAHAVMQHKAEQARRGPATHMAKKLMADYDRQLLVAPALRQCHATLKRARYTVAQTRNRQRSALQLRLAHEREREAERERATQLGGPHAALDSSPMMQASQFVLHEVDDQGTAELERAELRNIAKSAALLQEMATEVGCLVEVQQDDVNTLETNTDESVGRAIEGVHELSQYRKRQAGSGATKAAFGTATVGGLIGIIGGPVGVAIGAAAGGLVGMAAGNGVAAVKRHSINAETRRVKALLALRERKGGDFTHTVSVYETQAWSYMQRRWLDQEPSWRDEFGELCTGPHPKRNVSAPEARLELLALARSLSADEDDEVSRAHQKELELGLVWTWASPKWAIVMDRAGTDLAGWDYGPSATTDKWVSEAGRGCIVRRRLWVRSLVGTPRSSLLAPGGRADALGAREELLRGAPAPGAPRDETGELWTGIYRSTVTTNEIMRNSLGRVTEQGEQVLRSGRNAVVVGDIAQLSERIDRASRFSGAVRNVFSSSKGKLAETERFQLEVEHRQRAAKEAEEELARRQALEAEEARRLGASRGASSAYDRFADETSRTLGDNLRIATRMASELDLQNEQLDRTSAAIERGNAGMLKITKRIK